MPRRWVQAEQEHYAGLCSIHGNKQPLATLEKCSRRRKQSINECAFIDRAHVHAHVGTHTHTHTHTHTRVRARWVRFPEIQVRILSRGMGTFFPHAVSSIFRLSLTRLVRFSGGPCRRLTSQSRRQELECFVTHDCFTMELVGECLKCLFEVTRGVPALVV